MVGEPLGHVAAPSIRRQCSLTGVRLLSAPGKVVWRIAKPSWGPVNPPLRLPDSERRDWGRYDVLGHRTVYSGFPEVAAYGESLAALRVGLSEKLLLSELFDDVDDDATLLDTVDEEWRKLHHIAPGKVVSGWRAERRLYPITLPDSGWFIDIESAETISAVSAALGSTLAGLGVEQLTTANLRGEDRVVTTVIADWLWSLTLDDGFLPHGIFYGSKHDSAWECWASWLRTTDDGLPDNEAVTAGDGIDIEDPEHNAALREACTLFKLHCY